MQIIDINSFEQGQLYMMYDMYKSMEIRLDKKKDKTEEELKNLEFLKFQLLEIEKWANQKLNEKLHWTKEELLLNYGHRPTLIISFHPSTESYKKFGKEIVADIEFTEEELLEMMTNIQNKAERKSGRVKFKTVSESIAEELDTLEIFEIASRRI